ncbi:hypothetical protein B0H13DRAFT_1892424 [Mycena leptocephala]|nr:hypothetical protein B0H13DRAFT_1892424 [Mycena leptocephala]
MIPFWRSRELALTVTPGMVPWGSNLTKLEYAFNLKYKQLHIDTTRNLAYLPLQLFEDGNTVFRKLSDVGPQYESIFPLPNAEILATLGSHEILPTLKSHVNPLFVTANAGLKLAPSMVLVPEAIKKNHDIFTDLVLLSSRGAGRTVPHTEACLPNLEPDDRSDGVDSDVLTEDAVRLVPYLDQRFFVQNWLDGKPVHSDEDQVQRVDSPPCRQMVVHLGWLFRMNGKSHSVYRHTSLQGICDRASEHYEAMEYGAMRSMPQQRTTARKFAMVSARSSEYKNAWAIDLNRAPGARFPSLRGKM